jgi:hypothetical protein
MTKKFLLRINPELWDELNRWAADELRSVNGQIEYLLRQAVEKRKRAAPAPPEAAPTDRPPEFPNSGRA